MPADTLTQHGAQAYRRRLSQKQLEAEVFAQATRSIRQAEGGGAMDQARAVADNRRLWMAVHACVLDPTNALPVDLRRQIAGVALAVMRECDSARPDLGFVATVNEHFSSGLWT